MLACVAFLGQCVASGLLWNCKPDDDEFANLCSLICAELTQFLTAALVLWKAGERFLMKTVEVYQIKWQGAAVLPFYERQDPQPAAQPVAQPVAQPIAITIRNENDNSGDNSNSNSNNYDGERRRVVSDNVDFRRHEALKKAQ